MYLRTVKVPSSNGNINEYVRVVEAYRHDGKVKQRTIADLGRKDVLAALLPQLQRLLQGQAAEGRHPAQAAPSTAAATAAPPGGAAAPPADAGNSPLDDVEILQATTWGPVLVVRALFEQLGLWPMFDELLGQAKAGSPSYSDRAFVLLANRLIRPASEHGLARWLETDFVCDRQGRRFVPHWHTQRRVKVHLRQLRAWYRTLDHLIAAKSQIEVRLFQRLRDLFSLQPELVLFDITSTYFEGAGPALAKHGYSRDGKPQNVQVVVGLVMVGGWPIAHHVWAGNQLDVTSVQGVLQDLMTRFHFARVIFVGDRGMISEDNIEAIRRDGHGYLLGVKRRRNAQLDAWLQTLDDARWVDCPMGINAREKSNPPRTRVQEVATGDVHQRVFVIDSDERRQYEEGKRQQAMERTRLLLEKVKARVADGRLTAAAQIGVAAERALRPHKGYRYYDWKFDNGVFEYFDHPVHLQREKRLEGKYVIATSENIDAATAVAWYKQLIEVEHGFRHLKDVLAMRPIYHRIDRRVGAHIFVATLGLLLQTLLERRLKEADVDLSAPQAMQAVEIIRHVAFKLRDGQRSGISGASDRAQKVLTALGITNLRPPTPPVDDITVM
jgi:transposase